MAQMNLSNTMWNDTREGIIAWVEQLKDRLLKNYIATLSTEDRERIPNDIKLNTGVFQERLNEFFLKHWVDFQSFLNDEGVDPATIDSWHEVQEFLEGLPDDEARWLQTTISRLDNRITAMNTPDGGAYDVSADHTDGGGAYAVYASLSDAIRAIPVEKRKRGMTIRYIDSTTNKYVQYRLIASTWSDQVSDWQEVNEWLNSSTDWTEAQKAQARENIGLAEGIADIDSAIIASSDLEVSDDNGNVLIQAKNGHIKTKNFDSSQDATSEERGLMSAVDKIILDESAQKLTTIEEGAQVNDVKIEDSEGNDLVISDEDGNTLIQSKEGHIRTKNFDSKSVVEKLNTIEQGAEVNDISAVDSNADLEFSDENGNVVMRVANGHIKTKNFDSSSAFSLKELKYEEVLQMPHDTVKALVDIASGGRCAAIYDDDGYPSLMYKIPKVSIGCLAPTLGGLTDIHPAFVVNGVEKQYVYAAVFLSSLYNGHYVSWFGLPPKGQVTIPNLRTGISNKGAGWHLETIYERSLVSLLTMHMNSSTPTGNTAKGMSHVNTWEYCQMGDGNLPGPDFGADVGRTWINGTQPIAWSHNREQWGIYDVMGGFHEICDLFKIEYGKIIIGSDNNYFKKGDSLSTFEDDWVDTGAAYDLTRAEAGNILLNTSVNISYPSDTYRLQDYNVVSCSENYDGLSESIRKKLALLLLAPRLSSSDTEAVFPIAGRFGVNNNKPLCYGVFGGAEEYEASGLGAQIIAYPIDDNSTTGHNAHMNMGSRMFFIENEL